MYLRNKGININTLKFKFNKNITFFISIKWKQTPYANLQFSTILLLYFTHLILGLKQKLRPSYPWMPWIALHYAVGQTRVVEQQFCQRCMDFYKVLFVYLKKLNRKLQSQTKNFWSLRFIIPKFYSKTILEVFWILIKPTQHIRSSVIEIRLYYPFWKVKTSSFALEPRLWDKQ